MNAAALQPVLTAAAGRSLRGPELKQVVDALLAGTR